MCDYVWRAASLWGLWGRIGCRRHFDIRCLPTRMKWIIVHRARPEKFYLNKVMDARFGIQNKTRTSWRDESRKHLSKSKWNYVGRSPAPLHHLRKQVTVATRELQALARALRFCSRRGRHVWLEELKWICERTLNRLVGNRPERETNCSPPRP